MQMEKVEPKAGEVFFVNASAGAVGSVVGQMAKRKGMVLMVIFNRISSFFLRLPIVEKYIVVFYCTSNE